MPRVDNPDAFSCYQRPQFAVWGFSNGRTEGCGRNRMEPDAVVGLPQRRLDLALGIGDPRIQFGACDAHQTAGGVQPHRAVIVFDGPVDGVAWQTIPARERYNVAVFNPAKTALLCCGPQCAIRVELKAWDMTFTEPVR